MISSLKFDMKYEEIFITTMTGTGIIILRDQNLQVKIYSNLKMQTAHQKFLKK
jgi:hypothetical protein